MEHRPIIKMSSVVNRCWSAVKVNLQNLLIRLIYPNWKLPKTSSQWSADSQKILKDTLKRFVLEVIKLCEKPTT